MAARGNGDGFVLDIVALKTRRPLLLSVLQETQRTRHVNPSSRKALAVTLLEGSIFSKRASICKSPGTSSIMSLRSGATLPLLLIRIGS